MEKVLHLHLHLFPRHRFPLLDRLRAQMLDNGRWTSLSLA